MALRNLGKKAVKQRTDLDMGVLEKAAIYILDDDLKKKNKIIVQFNPQSYGIRRGVKVAKKKPVPVRDATMEAEAVSPGQASLSVTLVFDTYTEYGLGQSLFSRKAHQWTNSLISKADAKLDQTAEVEETLYLKTLDVCEQFLDLIQFDNDTHTVPQIAFVWGTMNFQGIVHYHTVNYTMFDKDGTPLRASIDLQIVGEESRYLKKNATKLNESPDRTKRRQLEYGEQLWMTADREYGNPAQWKIIARANDILNPRMSSGVMVLKIPSLQ